MEMKTTELTTISSVSPVMRIFPFICVLFCWLQNAVADPISELASFSVFDKVDLAALAKGEPKIAHGVPMGGRYISAQSCFVVGAPPVRVAEALNRWNPLRHSELKVLLHSDLSSSPGPENFSRLSGAPDNAAVRALVNATQTAAPTLQISKDEAKKVPTGSGGGTMAGPVANFWANVLSGRARAFASGGSAAQPAYDHTDQAVRPSEEFNSLLRQQDKIRRQFAPLIDSSGIGRGGGSLRPELFWELLVADDLGVLSLGAAYHRSGPNGTFQAADALYYASGGYYVGLTLYQLWPVDAGGRPGTLAWRGDLISSATIASLHGIERVASESSLMKDISKSINAFKRDIGGGR